MHLILLGCPAACACPAPDHCSVDFNTLDQKDGVEGGRRLRSTPTERLVWAVQVFFELFGGRAAFSASCDVLAC